MKEPEGLEGRALEQFQLGQVAQGVRTTVGIMGSQVSLVGSPTTAEEIRKQWPTIQRSVKEAGQVSVEAMQKAKEELESSGQGRFILDQLKGLASQFGLTDAGKGVTKLFGGSVKVYEGLLSGNFKKVQDGMTEYGSGLLDLAKGGLNFVGEMVGAKDIMRGFEALKKGDLLGAAMGFGFGAIQAFATVSTFGMGGAAFSVFARTVGKQWLQTGAKEAFQFFAKEAAEEVGEYMAKNIGKEAIEQTFSAAGKEVAKQVAEEGIEKVTAESIKEMSKEATKKATEKILSEAKVDEVISKVVEQRLDAISQNVSRKFTAKSKELFEAVGAEISDQKVAKQVIGRLQRALKPGKNLDEELGAIAKFMKENSRKLRKFRAAHSLRSLSLLVCPRKRFCSTPWGLESSFFDQGNRGFMVPNSTRYSKIFSLRRSVRR
jgi:DNA-binding ferritin-like protein (Dps family)